VVRISQYFNEHMSNSKSRRPYTFKKVIKKITVITFAIIFCLGLVWSFMQLELDIHSINFYAACALFFVFSPLNLLIAGYVLSLSAEILGIRIRPRNAFFISGFAAIAEILPIPGGGVVRGTALVQAGASMSGSFWIVTMNAMLTLSMTFVVASVPIFFVNQTLAIWCFLGGMAATTTTVVLMKKRTLPNLIIKSVAVRLVMLAVGAARLSVSFLMIGQYVSIDHAAIFLLTTSVGSAVSIVPAGLGLSEVLAATLAIYINISPAFAFVAVALNRLLGLSVAGIVALYGIQVLKIKFATK